MASENFFGPVISSYSRADALADGVLVDVTEWASATSGFSGGFTIPVALTAALWADIENIPKSLEGIADVRGRAHDVLWMASLAARGLGARSETRGMYKLTMPVKGTRKRLVRPMIDIGPGDNAEPVITIGYPSDF